MRILVDPSLEEAREAMLRPSGSDQDQESKIKTDVLNILEEVKTKGDQALLDLTTRFDGIELDDIRVAPQTLDDAESLVDEDLKKAIRIAKDNIAAFHDSQREEIRRIETMPGVFCWRESRPIEKVGLYIPGGTAPLISTVLMLGVPAQLAGCETIILCSPPDKTGEIHPAILYAASLCGIDQIYKVGGAQAIGAMTYGTETVPAVHKIFGPGNQYVTAAKMAVQSRGMAIDMPAGPSEVLVWADDYARPDFVAADLLAQAEHGADSQAILVCESEQFAENVKEEVMVQKAKLEREEIVDKSLKYSLFIVCDKSKPLDVINDYAPEHLIIQREDHSYDLAKIKNAGSVFVGPFTPESAGDYASGTNHTLPTNGYAKMYSGVSLDSFVKKITFQEIDVKGLQALDFAVSTLASAEGLDGHREAVKVRLRSL